MVTVSIHEAKAHLARLIEQAAKGRPFVIARAGKPLVKVTSLARPADAAGRRLETVLGPGVLAQAQAHARDAQDRIDDATIEQLLSGVG